jgi:hypothetical protein
MKKRNPQRGFRFIFVHFVRVKRLTILRSTGQHFGQPTLFPSREPAMNIHLSNADIVLIIAIALGTSLVLAFRLHTASWRVVVIEAIAANAAAIAAVVALEMLLA